MFQTGATQEAKRRFSARAPEAILQPELVQSESNSGSIIKSEVCSVWALRLIVISFSLADSQSGAEGIVCEENQLYDPETKPGDGGRVSQAR